MEVSGNKLSGYDLQLTIPSTIRDGQYKVTSIASGSFKYVETLASVTIYEGVTHIGSSAFVSCKMLTSVTLPESLTSIGDFAFSSCKKLTDVVIPDGVESMGKQCFYECDALRSVVIGESVTSIEPSTFYGCDALAAVSIGQQVTQIGDRAFYMCVSLPAISIPASVKAVGEQAFFSCTSLTEVIVPEGVESIGRLAFCGCEALMAVTLPESVTSFGWRAFGDCPLLSDVVNLSRVPQTIDVDTEPFSVFGTLHVKAGSKSAYAESAIWQDFDIVEDVSLVIAFDDGDSYTIQATREYEEVTYTRTFDHQGWQALYLPFALDYEEWCADYDIARINNVIEYDDDDNGVFDRTCLVVLRMTSGSTLPNHPYLVRAKSTGTHTLTLTDKTFVPSATNSFFCCSMDDTYTFTGTYTPLTGMCAMGYYAMDGGALKQCDSDDVVLRSQRWYMAITPRATANAAAVARARSISILVDGEAPTAIETLPSDESSSRMYDLSGRMVGQHSSAHGVYIDGGKKVIK